jgi:hypothetical protein
MIVDHYDVMTIETFNSSWVIFYDASECAYNVMPGSEWLRQDRESWKSQRMPTRMMLDLAESESAAHQRLKELLRSKRFEMASQVAV